MDRDFGLERRAGLQKSMCRVGWRYFDARRIPASCALSFPASIAGNGDVCSWTRRFRAGFLFCFFGLHGEGLARDERSAIPSASDGRRRGTREQIGDARLALRSATVTVCSPRPRGSFSRHSVRRNPKRTFMPGVRFAPSTTTFFPCRHSFDDVPSFTFARFCCSCRAAALWD